MLDIFKTLRSKFVPVDLHMNNYGCMGNRLLPSNAIEFTFVNRKLIKLRSESQTFAQHPLARPNNNRAPDCQIRANPAPPPKPEEPKTKTDINSE